MEKNVTFSTAFAVMGVKPVTTILAVNQVIELKKKFETMIHGGKTAYLSNFELPFY